MEECNKTKTITISDWVKIVNPKQPAFHATDRQEIASVLDAGIQKSYKAMLQRESEGAYKLGMNTAATRKAESKFVHS